MLSRDGRVLSKSILTFSSGPLQIRIGRPTESFQRWVETSPEPEPVSPSSSTSSSSTSSHASNSSSASPSPFRLFTPKYLVSHFHTSSHQPLPGFPLNMVSHHQSLLLALVYDTRPFSDRAPDFWKKLLGAEDYFEEQAAQITDELWQMMPFEITSFSRSLLKLRSTHVLTAWTGLKETARRVDDVRSFRDRVFSIVSNWMEHAIALKVRSMHQTKPVLCVLTI